MFKNIFVSIITANFAQYALALHDSLKKNTVDFHFAVYISNGALSKNHKQEIQSRERFQLFYSKDFEHLPIFKSLKDKYFHDYHDAFRWGMKPIFLNYLLKEYEKVIYIDSDLYFFNDSNFLFNQLDNCNVLLTPHWRSSDPKIENFNFQLNYTDGLYNAGFIGASRGAETSLSWWAEMILYNCEVNRKDGYYVDQRYLDLMPILFEDVEILKHKGCNVANWNKVLCKRTEGENGEVLINDHFPIVFIHFTNTMLTGILYKNDQLLKPYLEKYRDNLLKYSDTDIIEDYFKKGRFKKSRDENNFRDVKTYNSNRIFTRLKKLFKNK